MSRKKESAKQLKQLREFFRRYTFSLIFILFMANIGLLVIIRLFGRAEGCFTPEAISSDSRCLYILNGKVFEKGTRDLPHNAHPCGEDVTSILPASHLAGIVTYLDPNYKGDICTAAAPTITEIPTQAPQPTDIPQPTNTQQPNVPLPTNTTVPIPTAESQMPAFNPSPTLTSTIKVQCLVPPGVLNLRIDCPLCGN